MLDEAIFTAGDLMTRDVAVVHPETSLLDAVKLMAKRKNKRRAGGERRWHHCWHAE